MKGWGYFFVIVLAAMLQNAVAMQVEEEFVNVLGYGSMSYKKFFHATMERKIPLLCSNWASRGFQEHVVALSLLAKECPIVLFVPLVLDKSEYAELDIPEKILDPLLKHLGVVECRVLGYFDRAVQIGRYTSVETDEHYSGCKRISRITRAEKAVELEEWIQAIRVVLQKFDQESGLLGQLHYSFRHDKWSIVNQFFCCDYTSSCFELLE